MTPAIERIQNPARGAESGAGEPPAKNAVNCRKMVCVAVDPAHRN